VLALVVDGIAFEHLQLLRGIEWWLRGMSPQCLKELDQEALHRAGVLHRSLMLSAIWMASAQVCHARAFRAGNGRSCWVELKAFAIKGQSKHSSHAAACSSQGASCHELFRWNLVKSGLDPPVDEQGLVLASGVSSRSQVQPVAFARRDQTVSFEIRHR